MTLSQKRILDATSGCAPRGAKLAASLRRRVAAASQSNKPTKWLKKKCLKLARLACFSILQLSTLLRSCCKKSAARVTWFYPVYFTLGRRGGVSPQIPDFAALGYSPRQDERGQMTVGGWRVGVGWGAMLTFHVTCSRCWCYATQGLHGVGGGC